MSPLQLREQRQRLEVCGGNMFRSQNIKLTLAAALSLTMLSACGNPQNQQDGQIAGNIIGGTTSTLAFQKKNGVVALLSFVAKPAAQPEGTQTPPAANDNEEIGTSICTGSLLSKRVVLTAAHCVDDENLKAVVAVFTTDITKENAAESAVRVARVRIHPDYNGQNDMAVLLLAADAPADFQFAKLPETDITSELKGKRLTLAGYGVTNPLVNALEMDEKTGELVIKPLPSEGDGVLRQVSGIETLAISPDGKEFMVSGYDGKKGACHGDSGGPAYLTQKDGSFLLVGVTSRGTNPIGNCDRQAIYGSVAGQLDWVKGFLK